jgi:hypothetical protein
LDRTTVVVDDHHPSGEMGSATRTAVRSTTEMRSSRPCPKAATATARQYGRFRCTIGSFIVAEAMVALCRRRRRGFDGDGGRKRVAFVGLQAT